VWGLDWGGRSFGRHYIGRMVPYRFRPFARADLALVEPWLHSPEVARWWGEPARQLVLLAADLDEPRMRQWIVAFHDWPFAYVQAYEAHAWPQPHLAHLPAGTEVVDAFIGEPAMLGWGHGSAFLRLFATGLIEAGAPLVAIDPAIENLRARRAYARAGFAHDAVVRSDDGLLALMVFRTDG